MHSRFLIKCDHNQKQVYESMQCKYSVTFFLRRGKTSLQHVETGCYNNAARRSHGKRTKQLNEYHTLQI